MNQLLWKSKWTTKQPNKSNNKLSSLPIEYKVEIKGDCTRNFYQTLTEQTYALSKWLEKQI